MSAPTSYPFTVDNSYGQPVTVYLTTCQPVSDPPSTDASAYLPIYTSLGNVESGSGSFSTSEPIARVVIARASDDFPLKLAIVDALNPPTQSVSVASADEAITDSCWTFYKSFASQPYSPVALQFNALVLNNNDASQLNAQAAAFFSQNGYPGVDFGTFSIVSYWATNSLYAFPGSYYCYQPQVANSQFILPTEVIGMLEIANGTANYTPTGGGATALNLSNTALNSDAGVSPQVSFTGVVRDLTLEGQPNTIVMCFVGRTRSCPGTRWPMTWSTARSCWCSSRWRWTWRPPSSRAWPTACSGWPTTPPRCWTTCARGPMTPATRSPRTPSWARTSIRST